MSDKKRFNAYTEAVRKCKHCDASTSFLQYHGDVTTCYRCGHSIYRSDEIEFKKELEKRLKHV